MDLITLTPEQFAEAVDVGTKRQLLREHRNTNPPEYADNGGTHMDRHRLGAIAELALAASLGLDVLDYWRREQAYDDVRKVIPCDVGRNLHVRATTYRRGLLITHPSDPDDGIFVLAVVDGPRVEFRGWLKCSETKRREWWRDSGPGFGRRPAYGAPQPALRDMAELPPEAIR